MNEEELIKFIATLERFAENLRDRGEAVAAKAVVTILKYVKGVQRRKNHENTA